MYYGAEAHLIVLSSCGPGASNVFFNKVTACLLILIWEKITKCPGLTLIFLMAFTKVIHI
jgi:hypothetical protein